jgi:hypothetical protein
LADYVARDNSNPLMRVELLKRKFVTTQLNSLRTQIYALMRQRGATHAYALAEVDRALRDVSAAAQLASQAATSAAAEADAREQSLASTNSQEQPRDN